jgi:hypothetical protein
LGAALVACVVAAPIGVLANDKFNDVPFGAGHEEVSQIADAGIARGCGSASLNNFCPQNYVTRLQMAQFLSRTGGSASAVKVAAPGTLLGAASPNAIGTIDVDVPGIAGPGRLQRVEVDASLTVRAASTNGCPCQATVFLQDESGAQVSTEHVVDVADFSGIGEPTTVQLSVSFVFTAPTETEQTYFLSGENTSEDGLTPDPEALRAYGELTATTYPFPN